MNAVVEVPVAEVPRAVPSRRVFCRRWLRWIEHGLAILGGLFLVYHCGFNLSQVTSGSMGPALQGEDGASGDWVLAERISYRFRAPRRWEIVMFHTEEDLQVMKRVVGLPGEAVTIRNHQVWINGAPVKPPPSLQHLRYFDFGNVEGGKSVPCGRGYFVLGDDSRDSDDSRFNGPLAPKEIHGRAWLIVYPRTRLGFVNP
jgi:signal peptidase I